MTRFTISRRRFGLGLTASLAVLPAARAFGEATETRPVTTWVGTYDIPVNPRRVFAVDNRLDLETALALDLPLVGYARDTASPWVPVDPDLAFIPAPPSVEAILALAPDLIICMDVPDSDIWPLRQLQEIAPVLPTDYTIDWRENLANVSGWLGMDASAGAALESYDEAVRAVADRHAAKLDRYKVAVVHYFPAEGEIMVRGASSSQGRVLADIGGVTFDPAVIDEDAVSMENVPELFADVDAIFYNDLDDGSSFAALQSHPIWARVPAAAAGKVHRSIGNTNFGGVYSAMFIAREWDAVYSMLD